MSNDDVNLYIAKAKFRLVGLAVGGFLVLTAALIVLLLFNEKVVGLANNAITAFSMIASAAAGFAFGRHTSPASTGDDSDVSAGQLLIPGPPGPAGPAGPLPPTS